jgi:archaellum component FlaC
MEDFVHYAPLISAIVSLINLVGLIMLGIVARAAATRRDFHEIEKRVQKLETSKPDREDLDHVKKWLSDIHADVEGLTKTIDGHCKLLERTEHTVRLLEEHLLNDGK